MLTFTNRARALYTLSTSFLLPPASTSQLTSSISLYGTAITLTNSPLLQMDTGFNLAQACASLADMLEELEGDAEATQVQSLREQAKGMLENVLGGQEEYLVAMSNRAGEDDDVVEGIEGDAAASGGAEEESMAIDPNGEDGEEESTFETHLPTPSALVDTALALVDIHLSLWESAAPPVMPTDEAQAAVRAILERTAPFAPAGRQAELDLAEIKVLVSIDGIVWDLYRSEAKIGTGVERSLVGASMALGALLGSLDAQPPDEETVRADILTTLADTHTAIAARLISLTPQLPPGPSELAQEAWTALGHTIAHLTTALALPHTPSSPKEFKPNVLLSLSKASLARARLAEINETAQRNAGQLIENAATYATRAAEGLGWKTRFDMPSSPSAKLELPYPSGWDTELLARNIVLQQIRIAYYGSQTELVPASKAKYEQAAQALVGVLSRGQGERKVGGKDVGRWLGEIEDEEGWVGEQETAWWMRVMEKFEA
jgi:hypothetical protein